MTQIHYADSLRRFITPLHHADQLMNPPKDVSASFTLTEQLATILQRPVGSAARQRARWHVLDWLGCAALGATKPVGQIMAAALVGQPAGPCWALGQGMHAADAALRFNASLGNVLEMDDVHRSSILHPGPVVIPAALAVAQQRGIKDAGALLDAIVRGYEATIRIGRAVGITHYRYWHNTASCGGFGAAAAAGSLLNLRAQQLVWALGNAGSRSSGLWRMRHEDVMTKQWHTSDAAASGVMAAQLAAHGLSGPRAILEGAQGMFAAMSQDALPELVTRTEADWLIFDTSFKPWPACRHAHPAIDALLQIRAQQQSAVDWSSLVSIEVDTYADAVTFCDQPLPTTESQAKFSIQHALAAILTYGEPRLQHYTGDCIHDPAILVQRAKITVRADPVFTARFPECYGARVTLCFANGVCLQHQVNETRGDPSHPLSEAELVAKADMLMDAAGLSAARAARWRQACLDLSEGSSLAPFWAVLSEETA